MRLFFGSCFTLILAAAIGLGATWLSCEAPGVLPGTATPAAAKNLFTNVLARDGQAVAVTDGHGTWLQWLPGPP